jgi:hypothetical protein
MAREQRPKRRCSRFAIFLIQHPGLPATRFRRVLKLPRFLPEHSIDNLRLLLLLLDFSTLS